MSKISQKDLYFRFKNFVLTNDLIKAGDKAIVACSGGPDSICLLYLLNRLASEMDIKLIVAHYNHKLRGGEADKDEGFVKKTAIQLGLPFISLSADLNIKGEEQARELRYKFLEKVRGEKSADLIAVAHNIDDLSETMILNIIRGTGIRGLYSLRPKRGKIVRPLLFAEKKEITSYLKENNIPYRIDKSNKELVYTRNIIRHKILPEIEKINPSYQRSFARLSSTSASTDEFIRQYSLEILENLANNENGKIIFSQKQFTSLSPAVKAEIIRAIAEDYHLIKDLSETEVLEVVSLIEKNIGKKEKVLKSKLKIELKTGKIIVSKVKGVI